MGHLEVKKSCLPNPGIFGPASQLEHSSREGIRRILLNLVGGDYCDRGSGRVRNSSLPHQVASTLRTTVNPSENFRRSRLEFWDRGISRKRRRGAVGTAARFTPSHLLHEEISR